MSTTTTSPATGRCPDCFTHEAALCPDCHRAVGCHGGAEYHTCGQADAT